MEKEITIKDLHELDAYSNGDNEQQVTCPKCGIRTEFIEVDNDIQQHKCRCGYEFLMYFDDDDL